MDMSTNPTDPQSPTEDEIRAIEESFMQAALPQRITEAYRGPSNGGVDPSMQTRDAPQHRVLNNALLRSLSRLHASSPRQDIRPFILAAVAVGSGNKHWQSIVSRERLGKLFDVSGRTIIRNVTALEELGLIVRGDGTALRLTFHETDFDPAVDFITILDALAPKPQGRWPAAKKERRAPGITPDIKCGNLAITPDIKCGTRSINPDIECGETRSPLTQNVANGDHPCHTGCHPSKDSKQREEIKHSEVAREPVCGSLCEVAKNAGDAGDELVFELFAAEEVPDGEGFGFHVREPKPAPSAHHEIEILSRQQKDGLLVTLPESRLDAQAQLWGPTFRWLIHSTGEEPSSIRKQINNLLKTWTEVDVVRAAYVTQNTTSLVRSPLNYMRKILRNGASKSREDTRISATELEEYLNQHPMGGVEQ